MQELTTPSSRIPSTRSTAVHDRPSGPDSACHSPAGPAESFCADALWDGTSKADATTAHARRAVVARDLIAIKGTLLLSARPHIPENGPSGTWPFCRARNTSGLGSDPSTTVAVEQPRAARELWLSIGGVYKRVRPATMRHLFICTLLCILPIPALAQTTRHPLSRARPKARIFPRTLPGCWTGQIA